MNRIEKYDKQFIDKNMMGPNSMRILQEVVENLGLKKGMRVLDIGCGQGLTSIFLAKEFDVEVYAVDLWIPATENLKRFKEFGVDDKIIPLCFDATTMPFANEYFDAVISIDSYHYFGNNDKYFGDCVAPLLKKDALVAIAFPSIKQDFEFETIPQEMKPYWDSEAFHMWRSTNWWTNIFQKHLNNFQVKELGCFDEAWNDWLTSSNEYALEDVEMMNTDGGRYMNIVSFTGKIK